MLLAQIMANQGELDQASHIVKELISEEKFNPGAYYLSALIEQEKGNFKEACENLKRAVYLKPQFVLGHFALANLSRQEGRIREFRKHSENALHYLSAFRDEEILDQSEGLSAGRLREIIHTITRMEEIGEKAA